MTTQEWLEKAKVTNMNPDGLIPEYGVIREKATFNDGFTVSIQASSFHYCSPRDNYGPYTDVELGFPSKSDDTIMEYAEDEERPTETVYGYVPIAVVDLLASRHGGFV